MSRIQLPKANKLKSTAPAWIDKEALLEASDAEAKRKKDALSEIKSNAQIIVLSYFNPNTNAVFAADDPRLVAQQRLAAKGEEKVNFTDPDTDEPLYAYKTAKRVQKSKAGKYSELTLKPERGGTYTNTFMDRHIQYKALEEMQRYAGTKGMSVPRARYLRSSYGTKQLGSNLITINNIQTELEWYYGKNQKGRAFATISIDPAGKFILPLTFKVASGEDFEFNEENVRMLEKDARFADMMISDRKPKKTDVPTFRRPDPSRFMATASLKKEGEELGNPLGQPLGQPTAQPLGQPTAPGTYQPGTQYTNPADGKIYTMKSYDPTTGAVVTNDMNQDMSVPANEVQNLQPVMPTASKKSALEFSIETMAAEIVQKHLKEGASESIDLSAEVSDDQKMIDTLANKKKAAEKGTCDKCGKPNFICRGKCSGGGDDNPDDTDKKEDGNEDDTTDKESSLPSLNTKVAGQNVHFSHVPGMSKRWNEIRKEIREKLRKESAEKGDEHPFDSAPEHTSREQQESLRLQSVGYTSSPDKHTPNEAGRDPKSHIPTSSSGNVEIGMTEYPEFDQNFQESQEEMVERREHFQNQDKLPRSSMRRDEIEEYNDGKYKDKNYGLSETANEDEFENPELQFEASNDALAKEMISKKAMGEESEGAPIQERPIVHKDIKRAPGLEGYKEPETIEEASGKVKEGITKLHKVQQEIVEVKKKLQAVIAPLQKQLQEVQKPFNEDLIKKQESISSYIEMIYTQLTEQEGKISAYADKIFAVVERSKEEVSKATLPKLLAELETVDKETFDAVMKVKEAMESETVTSVLERFLYEYPVSKEHERKKVVRKSYDEEGSFIQAITILKDALMGLLNLGDTLEVNLESA